MAEVVDLVSVVTVVVTAVTTVLAAVNKRCTVVVPWYARTVHTVQFFKVRGLLAKIVLLIYFSIIMSKKRRLPALLEN